MHAPEHDRSAETMRPRVSILIVSYNTCAMTRACLDSIAAGAARTRYEIIVVDNASRDGSVNMIEAHAARPISIARQDNLGFAGGTNLAATHATGDLLLLLNPDTVVLPGAIDALVDFALARPVARIWGGRTLFADGRLNPSSAWGRMTLWRLLCRASGLTAIGRGTTLFNGEAIGGWARNSVREVARRF
jgi:GT2 family glycosyltransferase